MEMENERPQGAMNIGCLGGLSMILAIAICVTVAVVLLLV